MLPALVSPMSTRAVSEGARAGRLIAWASAITRLLEEIDGPMLRVGLQGFHGTAIEQPRDPHERPDPDRLRARFERFTAAA
jgi:hypothetical protein